MIVTKKYFKEVVTYLSNTVKFSCDTETTGLRTWHGDHIFSVIFADAFGAYYFNFKSYPEDPMCTDEIILPKEWIKELQPIFNNPEHIIFMHNAKFDMGMLDKEGINIKSIVHCTQAIARVEKNDHLTYDLDSCAERIGERKDDAVKKYILENDLWKWQAQPGKKTRQKHMFFNLVPLEIIAPYGERDALVTYKLGIHQENEIAKISSQNNKAIKKLSDVMDMERRLTKTCFSMEKEGVPIDIDYCQKAIEFETERYEKATKEFETLTGIEFVDSNKVLAEAFTRAGEVFPTTEKGNPSFTDEVLSTFTSPVAKVVQEYRDSYKRCNTYFRSFLYFSDEQGRIHPNIRQGGTLTGRMSYSEPNFQNLTKDEDILLPYPVRRAIIPPADCFLLSIDFDQQEFRLMLDYAGQLDLIKKIMDGFDPHESTAQLVGVKRRPAKILNFGLLYGMGIAKLARAIGCSELEARAFKDKYFSALDRVKVFIRNASQTAERRGFVFTWNGRRLSFPDPEFSYKAANGIIQGGCADIAKEAMNRIDEFLNPYKTKMIIQCHDEILFALHKSELNLIKDLKKIMEDVYPYRHIPLTCSVSHSFKSWGDMVEGEPVGEERRDKVQGVGDRSLFEGAS